MDQSVELRVFDTTQCASLSGLSKPMLDYLARVGIVPYKEALPGRGRKRAYGFSDIVLLRVLKRLLENGVAVSRMQTALRSLQKSGEFGRALQGASMYLVTDGRDAFLRRGSEAVERLSDRGQLSFAFVIELDTVDRQVREALEARAS